MFCRAQVFKCYSLPLRKLYRTFLSDEYKCATEWQSRLSAPFMQKVKLDTLFYDIDQSFQHDGKASAIDVDIYVNKMSESEDTHTDEIVDLLHRLRLTEETTNSLESTGHAVIRNFLDRGHTDELLQILDDRLSYGVFLDHYIASYCLDLFIKKSDFHSAARIATFLMLQEDLNNEISGALSLYACYRYLEKNEPFYPPKEVDDDKPKEEVKVRVNYLRNEFFDDHFDLRDHNHLVGKTLVMIGRQTPSDIGKNAELLGWILYQKYEKALDVASSSNIIFFKDVIKKCNDIFPEEEDNESITQLKSLLTQILSSNKLKEENFDKEIEKLVRETVGKNELVEIDKQKKMYSEWNQIRENNLLEERERLLRARRLKEIEKVTEDLKKDEEKLWFFENEDKIDLQIDSKIVRYPKRWFGKKKKPRVVDQDYVPPEIVKRRH